MCQKRLLMIEEDGSEEGEQEKQEEEVLDDEAVHPHISKYKQERAENIAWNREKMQSLGLLNLSDKPALEEKAKKKWKQQEKGAEPSCHSKQSATGIE